ncbi:ATP-binding protein [Flavobacterium sp. '19STA2R22 D10 B1']|uniref:ATP-binding protein n=1 Tax=Flavobacterium aerium TaxID=3037261 RepID=UPI00278C5119|nr:ATP-binding protein [Flavobacterium sp. '19STA2R22 D10 B1']
MPLPDLSRTIAITYFKTKTIIRFQDNGIGLSLIQKIILLHQGEIHVVSKQNEGTTFTVELPHV